MDEYQYEDIPEHESKDRTRILHLLPGSESEVLAGDLENLSVSNPPPFEALSYAWGSLDSWDNIVCDTKALRITGGLAAALRRLRQRERSRVIWVDQVCINQKNIPERSRQIRHMHSIYSKASKVLVWLGEDDGETAKRAFELIRSLAGISKDSLLLADFKQNQGTENMLSTQHWASLSDLFRVSWFDRKWILQEIGTGAPAELFWGNESVDWDDVSRASALLKDHGYTLRRQYDLLVWKPWYMADLFSASSYEEKALCFTYELHRARWQLASDPRDHVFSLLGHPSARIGPNKTTIIEADYTYVVEDLYHELAIRILNQTDTLMVLNAVQHDVDQKERSIPTWVPQWDDQGTLHNMLGDDTCIYQPSKNISPSPQFEDALMTLVLDGMIIDNISTLSELLDTSDFQVESATVAELWTQQCGNDGFETERKYVNGEESLFAFLETLSAVKKRKKQTPIPLSQRLCDAANFLVRAYGNTHAIPQHIRQLGSHSGGGDCSKWMERTSGGAKNRRFACSINGWYALCPPSAREGDLLCLLLGGKTLYCLRSTDDGYYQFVGECYVHGVMDGEAFDLLEKGEIRKTTFKIR